MEIRARITMIRTVLLRIIYFKDVSDPGCIDIVMTGVKNAGAVFYKQNLRRLVLHPEPGSHSVRYIPVTDKIEEPGIYQLKAELPMPFKPGQGHAADRAACAVLENKSGFL